MSIDFQNNYFNVGRTIDGRATLNEVDGSGKFVQSVCRSLWVRSSHMALRAVYYTKITHMCGGPGKGAKPL